ncbi:MAG: hypothetical protein QNK23_15685 [Crocinitomicaceae bacterium]|nr:hypothetical protein [Crocinitomicaceae bacterium]
MKATTLICAIACILPIACLSQQTNSNSNPIVTNVASNAVSTTITVHTYKLLDPSNTASVSDNDPQVPNTAKVKSIIEIFSSVEGVTRCTFDLSTHTFTILSSPTTDFSEALEIINIK